MIERRSLCRGRERLLFLVALALIGPSPFAHDQVPGAPQDRPVLLRGGDLYTVSHGVMQATDLLFEAGTITRIGKSLTPPEGAEVVDVSGQRVYPGLIAAQTSLGLIEISAVRATRDTSEVGAWTPEVSSHVAFNPDSEILPTVRAHGITTAQVVPGGVAVRGRTSILHLDGWTKEDAGVALDEGLQVTWPAQPGRRRNESDKDRKKRLERHEEQRTSFVEGLEHALAYHRKRKADPRYPIDVRLEAMRPAVSGAAPLYVQANDFRTITDAIATTQHLGLKMVLVGGRDAHMLTDMLVDYDIPVIAGSPTGLPPRPDDDYDLTYRFPALLEQAGVRFCLAQRSGATWSLRNLPLQAGHAVGHGLSRQAALRAMTLSAAEILGIDEQLGSLEEGKSATLFVSEGDVMDVLTQKVTHMFIEGRRIDLDNRHKQLFRKYDQRPVEN